MRICRPAQNPGVQSRACYHAPLTPTARYFITTSQLRGMEITWVGGIVTIGPIYSDNAGIKVSAMTASLGSCTGQLTNQTCGGAAIVVVLVRPLSCSAYSVPGYLRYVCIRPPRKRGRKKMSRFFRLSLYSNPPQILSKKGFLFPC